MYAKLIIIIIITKTYIALIAHRSKRFTIID